MENAIKMESAEQEVVILDAEGYDIEWFLCRCPDKTWVM